MIGQIFINDNGRFQVDTRELTCGDVLDVLIVENDVPRWIQTSVESSDGKYYLTGLLGFVVPGLFARVR